MMIDWSTKDCLEVLAYAVGTGGIAASLIYLQNVGNAAIVTTRKDVVPALTSVRFS